MTRLVAAPDTLQALGSGCCCQLPAVTEPYIPHTPETSYVREHRRATFKKLRELPEKFLLKLKPRM